MIRGPFMQWLARIRVRVDAWRFAAVRAEYYDYLQAVLRGMHGHRTLGELFELDARRHGPGTVRGRLSADWSGLCAASGGDLYSTWMLSFPRDELVLVRAAQAHGNARLLACFEALGNHLVLIRDAHRVLWTTLAAAVFAVLTACLSLVALPMMTVPALMRAFQGVPETYHGPVARRLFSLASWVESGWPIVAAMVCAVFILLLWSLPNTWGPLRRVMDHYGLWRLYRHVQAVRLLTLLAILLGGDKAMSTQLRTALVLLEDGATPWARHHVRGMLVRIAAGVAGADTFDTGLLDREVFWFLQDMVAARGLHAGLDMACARMRGRVLGQVARQAAALRWTLMLASVACVLGMGLWHYAAMDELRRALMMFHASQ